MKFIDCFMYYDEENDCLFETEKLRTQLHDNYPYAFTLKKS